MTKKQTRSRLTLVGLDSRGRPIRETITLPRHGGSVTSKKAFALFTIEATGANDGSGKALREAGRLMSQRRRARGLSVARLAKHVESTAQEIRDVERGAHEPSYILAWMISVELFSPGLIFAWQRAVGLAAEERWLSAPTRKKLVTR